MTVQKRWLLATLLVAAGVVLRLVPHEPNFTAVGAVALFAGAMFDKRLAAGISLTVMILSDTIVGYYPGMLYTWLAVLGITSVGALFRRKAILPTVFFGSLGGCVAFFIISNFGVWHLGGLYPHTLDGLALCYIMAVPFFGATLASSVIYGSVLFGIAYVARRWEEAAVKSLILSRRMALRRS